MFDPSKFTVKAAKPLPVLLMLDTSSSMSGIKIDTLNKAVRIMIEVLAEQERLEVEIWVSIITFGNEVKRLFPFTPASQVKFSGLSTGGMTPLGVACKMAKAIIEDRDETPGRAYRPTVVLVSDGQPTDVWEDELRAFVESGRSSKCDRMAMAIGGDANREVLEKFVEGTSNPLFEAQDAADIRKFFNFVTMSVTTRVASKDPNKIPSSYPPQSSPADDVAKTDDARDSGVSEDDEDSYF